MMKNNQKMTEKTLLETFDVKKTSPLYSFAKDLAKWMVNNLEEQNIKDIHDDYIGNYDKKELSEEEMIQEIIDDYSGIDEEDLRKVASKEYRYYSGSASNDSGEALEGYLCDAEFNIDTETLKIRGGGGY